MEARAKVAASLLVHEVLNFSMLVTEVRAVSHLATRMRTFFEGFKLWVNLAFPQHVPELGYLGLFVDEVNLALRVMIGDFQSGNGPAEQMSRRAAASMVSVPACDDFWGAMAETMELILEKSAPADNEIAKKLLIAVLAYGDLVKQTFDKLGTAQWLIPRSYNLLLFFATKCYKIMNPESPIQNAFNPSA